jgi:hypothetical protein
MIDELSILLPIRSIGERLQREGILIVFLLLTYGVVDFDLYCMIKKAYLNGFEIIRGTLLLPEELCSFMMEVSRFNPNVFYASDYLIEYYRPDYWVGFISFEHLYYWGNFGTFLHLQSVHYNMMIDWNGFRVTSRCDLHITNRHKEYNWLIENYDRCKNFEKTYDSPLLEYL